MVCRHAVAACCFVEGTTARKARSAIYPSATPPREVKSNAHDLWIGLGLGREGRTFPSDRLLVIE